MHSRRKRSPLASFFDALFARAKARAMLRHSPIRTFKEAKKMFASYTKGLKHGIPIALGYLSVSFAFGIQATSLGLSPLQTVMISFFNVTSAGQLAGLQLMAAGAPLVEMALTQLTINLRYALMSLSLSQKLDSSMTLIHRLLLSFCNTDEVFVVASQQPGRVGRAYLYGLTNGPFLGWTAGTLLGALAGGILPGAVTEALGLAIYGMFIAIILPPFRRSREVRTVILISVCMSCLFAFVPLFGFLSSGFRIIVCAVVASALGAWLMPRPVKDEEEVAA